MIESAVVVDSNGKILKVFRGVSEYFIESNTGLDGILLLVEPPVLRNSYWSFSTESWIDVGMPPDNYSIFNYANKSWTDPRNLVQVKLDKWSEIKKERDAIEFGGFIFEGHTYDSNQVSQGRILGAASAGVDQIWTLSNNETVFLTSNQLVGLYQALQMHVANIHNAGREARYAINNAVTIEAVLAVTL